METTDMVTTETGAIRSCEYSGGAGRPEANRVDLLFLNRDGLECLAEAFARGLKRYGRDNWKRGFKESVLIQHSLDHLMNYLNHTCDPGEEDVDQLSGVLWNFFTLCWVRKHKPELLDLTGPDQGPTGLNKVVNQDLVKPNPDMVKALQEEYNRQSQPSLNPRPMDFGSEMVDSRPQFPDNK